MDYHNGKAGFDDMKQMVLYVAVVTEWKQCLLLLLFLASQDAIEVMFVCHWLTVRTDLTDVTLVSDYTYRRLYWCDPDHPDDTDESYLVMKVI